LKEANKKQRLEFCVSMLEESSLPNNQRFKDKRNIVHLDEKWFNGTTNTRTMYMAPDEEDPHRTVQNKNYITKVMFLSAQTRPCVLCARNLGSKHGRTRERRGTGVGVIMQGRETRRA
jgi:hypothetical protein